MTVRLEELLAAALGDDPWYPPNYGEIRTKNRDEISLIALAPEMARLLIEWAGDDPERLARLDRLGNQAEETA